MRLAKRAAISRPTDRNARSPVNEDHLDAAELMLDEPVFILTCPRSGSTLLRILLDAHPQLACPPETNIGQWCAQQWNTWAMLAPDCSLEQLTEEALRHIRSTVDAPFAAYLRKRGKSRWCDKSLDSAKYADQIAQVYGKAKFVCLHRHAMDMINSGLEATPWGLNGYGFNEYSGSPNSVSALAESWIQSTARILGFEDAHPDRCIRVYYEQLVQEPQRVMDSLFDFLGVIAAPRITQDAFTNRSTEKYEIGDHKIRTSGRIFGDSVGTGLRVPSHLMPLGQQNVVNQLLDRLGYTQIDRSWRMAIIPPALFADQSRMDGAAASPIDFSQRTGAKSVGEPQESAFAVTGAELKRRISLHIEGLPAATGGWSRIAIAAYSVTQPRTAAVWLIDRLRGDVTAVPSVMDFEGIGADWAVTGDINAWRGVLCGQENMAKAIRQGYIRFIGDFANNDNGDSVHTDPSMQISDSRLQVITHLLGLD